MDDLIRRQEVLELCDLYEHEFCECDYAIKALADDIKSMLTINPVKHGKWMPHPTEKDWDVCSVCGLGTHRRFHYNEAVYGGYDVEESFAFCPNCGARME